MKGFYGVEQQKLPFLLCVYVYCHFPFSLDCFFVSKQGE